MSSADIQKQLNSNLQHGQFNLDASSSDTHITGTFLLNSAQFNIVGNLDAKSNTWLIATDASDSPTVSMTDLVGVIGTADVTQNLPLGIAAFSSTQLVAMNFSIGATNAIAPNMTFTVSPNNNATWEIVPGSLAIGTLQLSSTVGRSPLQSQKITSTFYGSISGIITIGRLPFYVALGLSDSNTWVLQVGNKDHPALPSLSDLAGLLGESDPSSFLNETMSALKFEPLSQTSITQVAIAFDRFTASLMYVQIGFASRFRGITVVVQIRLPDLSIEAGLDTTTRPSLLTFLQTFDPKIPDPDGALSQTNIAAFAVSAAPQDQTYSLNAQLTSSWTINIPVGGGNPISFNISSLTLDLEAIQNNFGFSIIGIMTLFGQVQLIVAASRPLDGGWTFMGSVSTLMPVNLGDLIDHFVNPTLGGQSIDLSGKNLATLDVKQLMVSVQSRADGQKTYAFMGQAAWKAPIGDQGTFEVDAAVSITKPSGQPATGYIQGSLFFKDFFFNNLDIIVRYDFSPTSKSLTFTLRKDGKELSAILSYGPTQDTILTIKLQKITVGDILTFLVNLVNPYLDFKLEAPWDLLNSIDLSSLSLTVNLTKRTVGITYTNKIELGFMTITSLTFTYEKVNGQSTVTISLGGNFLGTTYDPANNPLKWDALNDAPPAVPGKGNGVFDLDYLGVGQHVALQDVSKLNTVEQVILALQNTVVPIKTSGKNPIQQLPGLVFNTDSGWLIGAKFSVLNTVAISLVFNDPEVYGLLITLSGAKAKIFAGLKFEILYHKISNTVGVYHIELKLPDAMRNLEFGTLSITLPVFVLDIYTNGDFRIDVGFPTNGDFSRSFGVQYFPFVGYGGFYFAKLSSDTSTNVPKITNGTFNPVIEFGLGLSIGVGKEINKGIFSAGLTVTAQGIFEGVFGWFRPTDTTQPDAQYFKLVATLALVGHLYGKIDFAVIQASVDITVYVAVKATFEVYQPMLIDLVAGVSVKVSVKILFIRIHLSFSTTIRANFVLGSASPTPWHVAGKSPQRMLQSLFLEPEVLAETPEFGLRMSRLDLIAAPATTPPPLNWGAFGIWTQPRKLDLLFEPNFTILTQSGSNKAGTVAGLALLFIQNAMPAEDSGLAFHELFVAQEGAAEMPFNILVEGILGWAILAYANRSGTPPAPPSSNTCQSATPGSVDYSAIVKQTRVSLADLSELYTVLVDTESGGKLPFTTPSDLPGFLKTNFCFNLTLSSSNQSATYFPMLPELTMIAGSSAPVDFGANPIPDTYLSDVEKFVQALQVQFENAESGSKSARAEALIQAFADGSSGLSMAGFIFQDYFAIIARSAVQAAMDYLETQSGSVALSDLLAQMRGADAINTIAGMVSRFLLHGLRLPTPKDEQNLQALYLLTGQQFNVPATLPTDYSIQLKADPAITWLQFPSGSAISYNITANNWGPIIQQLSQATFSPKINSVRALQNYQIDAQRYIFQHQRVWQTASSLNLCATPSTGTLTLWQFPSTLTDALGDAKALPLDVTLWEATPATSGNTGLDKHQAQCFAWATMVSLGVQQVPSAAATGMLPNIYQLQGTTEEGRMLLESLWPILERLPSTTTAKLFLLYPQSNTGGDNPALLNDAGIDPLLLKVNLSTQSNPQAALLASDEQQDETRAALGAIDTIYNATFAQATNFVRLVWEASVTNSGGYYLYYQTSGGAGFPDYLFGNGPTAQLSLLIVLEASDYSKLHSQLQAFHNVVLLADTLRDDQVLYATANQITVKHATIPAGTVGFQIDRTPQPEATLQGRLDELYNLIGYSVAANSFFKASIEGLPVGPTFDQNDNEQAVSDDWRYQRVVPTYPWAINNSLSDTANPLLPPADQNPYAGLSAQSTIALAFSYHDTFGNQIAGPPTLPNLSAPVRYIDPLLGITLWPSVAAGYTFTVGDSQSAKLNFVLHFDSSKYMPSAGLSFAVALEKIKSDRFSYQQIYYQIHQPDVTFSLTTTVNSSVPFNLTAADFARLTDAIYLYLATLATFVEEFSYTVPTSDPADLQTIATTYGVTVGELADQNSTIINIFSAGTALKIPLYYRIVAGQTIETIAQQSGISTATLLAQAADDPAFLQPGTVLATGQTLSYTVQGKLALAQIAAQFADVAPGDVAAANAGVVVGVDSLNIRNTPTTSTGKTLNELIAAYNAANPNEPALTAAEIGTANQDLLSFFADTTPLTIPVLHEVLAGETVTIITRIYGITAAALLQHNPNNTRLLNPNVRMLVTAESYSTVAGDTLLTITEKANITIAQHNQSAPLPYELISTADLGSANATVALNPNLGPRADDLSQTVPAPLLIPERIRLAALDISGYALHQVDGSKDTLASLAANQNPADLAVANADVDGLLNPGGQMRYSGVTLAIGANDTFNTMQDRFNASFVVTADTLTALSAQDVPAELIAKLQPLVGHSYADAAAFIAAVQQALDAQQAARYQVVLIDAASVATTTPATVELLGEQNAKVSGLLKDKSLLLLPPPPLVSSATIALQNSPFPANPIFPLTVEIAMSRDPKLIDPNFADTPSVQTSSTTLAPNPDFMATGAATSTASLQQFAADFEQAFLYRLKLATGNRSKQKTQNCPPPSENALASDNDGASTRSLWAVNLSSSGIDYRLTPQPLFFIPAPLANVLLDTSGAIQLDAYNSQTGLQPNAGPRQVFHAIDLDSWGRAFLEAVDAFLDPTFVVPATQIDSATLGSVQTLLKAKQTLADAITARVIPVFDYSAATTFSSIITALGLPLSVLWTQYHGTRGFFNQTTITVGQARYNATPQDTIDSVAKGLNLQPNALVTALQDNAQVINAKAVIAALLDSATAEAAATLEQRLLIALSEAYTVDSIVQYNVGVQSPCPDPDTAPNLFGKPIARSFTIPDKATLATIGAAFPVHLSPLHVALTLYSTRNILAPGVKVGDYTITSQDTIETLAIQLTGGDIPKLVALLQQSGAAIFKPNTVVPLAEFTFVTSKGVGLIDIAQYFQLTPYDVVVADQDLPDLLVTGATIKVGGNSYTVKEHDTFAKVATALHASLQDLSTALVQPSLSDNPIAPNATFAALKLQVDYSLSTAKVALNNGQSHLTFVFSTKNEGSASGVFLDLSYKVTALEFDIENLVGIEGYQASGWLSFLIPIDANDPNHRNRIGQVAVPVPIRAYPTPPGLVAQQMATQKAQQLGDVRKWQYQYTYDHANVMQDTIHTQVQYNVPLLGKPLSLFAATQTRNLFEALANFTTMYPAIQQDLLILGGGGDKNVAKRAVQALQTLTSEVAQAWSTWQEVFVPVTVGNAEFEISEIFADETLSVTVTELSDTPIEPDDFPQIQVPGYEPLHAGMFKSLALMTAQSSVNRESKTYQFQPVPPPAVPPSIPQVTVILPDLDIVSHQNAWGGVWVIRNANLNPYQPTNPHLIYQTAAIKFKNPLVPLISNNDSWNQGSLTLQNNPSQEIAELTKLLQATFDTLLPASLQPTYVVKVTVAYNFILQQDPTTHAELASFVPILLLPRGLYTPGNSTIEDSTAVPLSLAELAKALIDWYYNTKPSANGAYLRLSLSLFPQLSGVTESTPPVLQVNDLRIELQVVGV